MAEDDPLAEIKAEVATWARYVRARIDVGYPPHSWEGRSQIRGGAAPNPSAARVLPSNQVAERIEALVIVMPANLRRALVQKHLRSGPDTQRCRYLRCCVSTFKERVKRGYIWLNEQG